MSERIPYLKRVDTGILSAGWKRFEGAAGSVVIDDLALSTDKRPPALPNAPPETAAAVIEGPQPPKPTAAPAAAPAAPPTGQPAEYKGLPALMLRMVEGKPPPPAAAIKIRQIPPFDLLDIPQAMKAMEFAVAAKLSRRWLDGRYYLAPITFDATGNQKDGRYDADMIDKDTVKMSWLMGYRGVKNVYQTLRDRLAIDRAISVLNGRFEQFFQTHSFYAQGDFRTLEDCGGDLQNLHQRFQFQRSPVSIWAELDPSNLKSAGMTDLMAALGSFDLYAAVARFHVAAEQYIRFRPTHGSLYYLRRTITVSHIYVYAKDSYSFYDNGYNSSQYLGHWNKTGVILSLPALIAEFGRKHSKVLDTDLGSQPIQLNVLDTLGKLNERDLFYSVRNRDYMQWRDKHHRGGDFLIFSDLHLVKLDSPIEIHMEEPCPPRKDY